MPITIKFDGAEQATPVLCQYPGQHNPQPSYIYLDEDGEVTAGYNAEIGGAVSMDEWHNRTLRWRIPSTATCTAIAERLADPEILALLERVHAGHSVEWEGSNHRGRLTDDAQEASDRLSDMIGPDGWFDSDIAVVWQVDDWMAESMRCYDADGERASRSEAVRIELDGIYGAFTLKPESTDDDLRKVAEDIEASAMGENAVLADEPLDWLRILRKQCQDNSA